MNNTFSNKLTNEKTLRVIFIIGFFIILFIWAYVQPFDSSPDERMRYVIPQYIYDTGTLPRTDDFSIADEEYGFSYAGRPMLSSFIAVFFMKIISLFFTTNFALLMAARIGSIACGIGFIIYVMKIANELFLDKSTRWTFIILTTLWPQCAFMFTYVNSDSLALFSIAMIIYYWIKGAQTNWKLFSCIGLGIGLAMGAQAYYNMYGYILCSAIFFILHHIFKNNSDSKYQKMFSKGILIVFIVFALSGWFFIRNAILYDGDVLGNRITFDMGNTYGAYGSRPIDRATNSLTRLSTADGIISWILLSCRSFIGCFGYMSIPLKWWMYAIYCAEILIGILGVFFVISKKKNGLVISKDTTSVTFPGYSIWIGCLLATCSITLLLDIYFTTLDYQPQGRYLLPALIPFTYFLTNGISRIKKKLPSPMNILINLFLVVNIIIFLLLPIISY